MMSRAASRQALLGSGQLLLGVFLCALGCTTYPKSQNAPTPVWTGFILAPPLPGNSLYESEECRCVTCRHDSCCFGESLKSDDCDVSGQESEGDQCELKVGSCSRSCMESTWRVPVSQPCDSRRPEHCCSEG
jgi:hypothetical protein